MTLSGLAATLIVALGLQNPLPNVRPMDLTAATPVIIQSETPEQSIQRLQHRHVASYFEKTLRNKDSSIDPSEAATLNTDLEQLWKSYTLLGKPYDESDFLKWWQTTQLKNLRYGMIHDWQNMDLDQLLHLRLIEYIQFKADSQDDPLYISSFFGLFISNPTLHTVVSKSVHWLIIGLAFGFAVQVLGNMVRSYLHTVIGPAEGRAATQGSKHLGRIAVPIKLFFNRGKIPTYDKSNGEDADPAMLSFERDGLELPGMSKEMVDANMEILKSIWAWAHQVKSSIFTGELMDGRDTMTQNIHWRENHLAQLLSNYLTEANTHELLIEQRIDRMLRQCLAKPCADELSLLFSEIQEINAQDWATRDVRFLAPQNRSPALTVVAQKIFDHGVSRGDLAYILAKSDSKIMATEKLAVALTLQVIQDLSYPEHNRAQIAQIRGMQKVIRMEYNFHPVMKRHQHEVIRVLKKMGLKAEFTETNDALEISLDPSDESTQPCAEVLKTGTEN